MKDNQHEELFTELTSEQASAVEGGGFVLIESLEAIKTGADPWIAGKDDTYIKINGAKIWSRDMAAGDYATVNRGVGFNDFAAIRVFDADSGLTGDDDYIGGFDVSSPTNGRVRRRLSGSGSIYDLYYRVFA